jgi:hypothetical protein
VKPPIAKLLTGFAIVAALLVVASVIFTLSQPAPAPPPLPTPNGYDDFVKAGGMIADDSWHYGTMSEEKLRAFVQTNAEALKLARAGLDRKCRVPLDYSPTGTVRMDRLSRIKALSDAMSAAGRLAELEHRPTDAAEAYLAVIRLGSATSQGGILIDSLVGVAVEGVGSSCLEKLAPTLDAKQCLAAAAILESCESSREPPAAIWARERTWARQALGLKGLYIRLVCFRSLKQSEQRATAKLQRQASRVRHLLIELAARAYELEKGERPRSLADLVPVYLKTIPQDPLTGTNMAYP